MTQPPDNQGLGQPRYDDPLSPGTPVPGSVADVGRVDPVDYPVGAGVTTGSTAAGGSTGGSGSTKDVAKEQAADVKDSAKDKAADVAQVAKGEAQNVTQEARRQAKDLLHQGRSELQSQTRQQQQRAAGGLHTIADQLLGVAEGREAPPGPVSDLAHEASQRIRSLASQLETREPAELLDEVRRFARQRPGTFLGLAAVAGVLAGRLTRGVKDASSDNGSSGTGYSGGAEYTGTPVAGAYGTGTYGTSASGDLGTGTEPVGDYGTTTSTGYGTGTTGVPGSAGDTTPFGDPEAYDVPGRSGGTYPTTGGSTS
jgi:ElaB/YqjD/DUF883 family membrane-anchored ribosome-binding protein